MTVTPGPARLRGRLAIVYHRPFWRRDGELWESEGAFSRFVEALAAQTDAIDLVVPETVRPVDREGHRLDASNVQLRAMPNWHDLIEFYRVLPRILWRIWRESARWDVVVVRLPTPMGFWAWAVARLRHVPTFLMLVGDLAEVAETVPGTSWKRRLYRVWARLEDRLVRHMVRWAPTFANGQSLWSKYGQGADHVILTTNSTISMRDIVSKDVRPLGDSVRLLCISRIDPRKGVRHLPAVLADLRDSGIRCRLTVVGGDVGELGRQERELALTQASALGVTEMLTFLGAQSIEAVHQHEREHDVLLVPSLPGEGVPRVIVEAFAAGLPVVATNVAGIPGVVHHGENGLLVDPGQPREMAEAVRGLIQDNSLYEHIVACGIEFARSHTIEAQTETILKEVRSHYPSLFDGDLARSGIRVNIPFAGMNLSGGVKSLLFLANALGRRGHRVRVIVPDYASNPPIALGDNVKVQVVSTWFGPSALRKVAYFARLSIIAVEDCDLCLANYFLTTYPSVISRTLSNHNARLAYNIRGYEPMSHGTLAEAGGAGRRIRSALASLSFQLPLQKICSTDWLKRMVGDPRAIVIGHGIDRSMFSPGFARPDLDETVRVGVIGRSGEVKGYPDFLRAVELLPPSTPIRIVIAGGERVPMPAQFAYEARSTPDEAAMANFYRACDVFIFPSRAEGFGLPPLEAMASGAAVILTDCGGVSTYAEHEKNCLMVPVNDPVALAEAISRLVTDRDLREALVAAGLRTAARFERADVEERFCDLLESLVRGVQ